MIKIQSSQLFILTHLTTRISSLLKVSWIAKLPKVGGGGMSEVVQLIIFLNWVFISNCLTSRIGLLL